MNEKSQRSETRSLLDGARVYLSGPMDFVASREEEMKNGWRTRIGAFLRARGCIVFDPWQKPAVRGLQEYGREGLDTARIREAWTFKDNRLKLLTELENQVPIKPNPKGIPSLWYMPLVGGESFFDGFGFDDFRVAHHWPNGPLDVREKKYKPKRPLLGFLDGLAYKFPQKWDSSRSDYVRNDDWLLWDLHHVDGGGEITGPHDALHCNEKVKKR